MKRMDYYNEIADRLNSLKTRIQSAAVQNLYDLHIHCESFYMHLLNLLYGWELKNINVTNRNEPGIDLIDSNRKIIIQVSATCTKAKIQSSIDKTNPAYRNYRFKFISIAENADSLRDKRYSLTNNIDFDPNKDIIDIDTILREICAGNFKNIEEIYDLVGEELEISGENVRRHAFTETWFRQKVIESIKNIGERYSQELDIELEISAVMDAVEQNEIFQSRFKQEYKKLKESYERLISGDPADYSLLKKYIDKIGFLVDQFIDKKYLVKDFGALEELTACLEGELGNDSKQEKNIYKSFMYQLFQQQLREYMEFITSEVVRASVCPNILLVGGAGVGKSHFIAHHAKKRADKGKLSLLFLGQLFQDMSNPFLQMKKQLGVSDTVELDEILRTMDEWGRENNSKAILFIDALNEGEGNQLWAEYLSGVIYSLNQYDFISVVLSVRDTYYDQCIPANFRDKNNVLQIDITNCFDVNQAMIAFFSYYKVPYTINIDLRVQLSNPLLLKLYCISYSEKNKDTYGIEAIMENYFAKLDKDIRKRQGGCVFPRRINLIESALKRFIDLRIQKNSSNIEYHEINAVLMHEFSSYHMQFNVLDELIGEGVLSCVNYNDVYYVHLAYELFDNFLAAKRVVDDGLNQYHDCKSLVEYIFSKKNKYYQLIEKDNGILEALAVILPDLDLAVSSDYCEMFYWPDRNLNLDSEVYYKSMLWRRPERIKRIAHSYIINESFIFMYDKPYVFHDFCSLVLQVSLVKNHIYHINFFSDFLYGFCLDDFNMFWTSYISKEFHQNKVFKILIKWAWNCKDNYLVEDLETMKALADTMVWFLASVNHKVRDMSLKALTHLYMENIEILINHIVQYQYVKDKYILEGIWAAAYGAVLNGSQPSGLERLGDAIALSYAGCFVNSIIIRSYIENIISYLIYKKTKSTRFDLSELTFRTDPYDVVDENEIEKIRGGYLYPNDIRTLEFIDMDNEIYKEDLLYEHDRIIQNLELSFKSVELEGIEKESFWTPEIIDLIPESDRSNFVRLVIKEIFLMGFNYLKFMDRDLHTNNNHEMDSIAIKYEWVAVNKVLDIYLSHNGYKLPFDGVWQIPFHRRIDPTIDFFSDFDTGEITEKYFEVDDIFADCESIFRMKDDKGIWIAINEINYIDSNKKNRCSTGLITDNENLKHVIEELGKSGRNPTQAAFEDLYVRELYWSKAYDHIQNTCRKTRTPLSNAEFVSESYVWDISDGAMGRGFFSFSAVSKYLFEELELEMKQGVFELYKGNEIVAISMFEKSYRDTLLIQEECLTHYLENDKKCILWPFFDDRNKMRYVVYDGREFRPAML